MGTCSRRLASMARSDFDMGSNMSTMIGRRVVAGSSAQSSMGSSLIKTTSSSSLDPASAPTTTRCVPPPSRFTSTTSTTLPGLGLTSGATMTVSMPTFGVKISRRLNMVYTPNSPAGTLSSSGPHGKLSTSISLFSSDLRITSAPAFDMTTFASRHLSLQQHSKHPSVQ
jgi:hypothetical protein